MEPPGSCTAGESKGMSPFRVVPAKRWRKCVFEKAPPARPIEPANETLKRSRSGQVDTELSQAKKCRRFRSAPSLDGQLTGDMDPCKSSTGVSIFMKLYYTNRERVLEKRRNRRPPMLDHELDHVRPPR